MTDIATQVHPVLLALHVQQWAEEGDRVVDPWGEGGDHGRTCGVEETMTLFELQS